jgi:hypothetical protein
MLEGAMDVDWKPLQKGQKISRLVNGRAYSREQPQRHRYFFLNKGRKALSDRGY